MTTIRIALVGIGKIARDQHVPALEGNADFAIVGAASPHHKLGGVPNFPDVETLLDGLPDLDAVAICTPPQIRYDIARTALERGRHVLLEKPPAATLNEAQALVDLAGRQQVALYASWHSRSAAAVEPARRWLAGRRIRNGKVTWKEDVRVWHPGQTWIFKAGGLGVFDPAINALSILTHILPDPVILRSAELAFPSNCETPIAATIDLRCAAGATIAMELDFLHTGPPTWDIGVETDDGRMLLSKGGTVLQLNDDAPIEPEGGEYDNLYRAFSQLVLERRIDVDCAPLRLVADAFMCGRRSIVAPFVE